MNLWELGKEFALNLGQDVGMDAANYGTGKMAQRKAIKDGIITQDIKGNLIKRDQNYNVAEVTEEDLKGLAKKAVDQNTLSSKALSKANENALLNELAKNSDLREQVINNVDDNLTDRLNFSRRTEMANAIKNGADADLNGIYMRQKAFDDANEVRKTEGKTPYESRQTKLYAERAGAEDQANYPKGHYSKHSSELGGAEGVVDTMERSINGNDAQAYPAKHDNTLFASDTANQGYYPAATAIDEDLGVRSVSNRDYPNTRKNAREKSELLGGGSSGRTSSTIATSEDASAGFRLSGRRASDNDLVGGSDTLHPIPDNNRAAGLPNSARQVANSSVPQNTKTVDPETQARYDNLRDVLAQRRQAENAPAQIETEAERNKKYDNAIKRYYKKYGENFEEKMPSALQDRYNELLDKAPRDKSGNYTDPITGGKTIDAAVRSDELVNELPQNGTEEAAKKAREIQDALERNKQKSVETKPQVTTGTEPLGRASDGTPEFINRYTSQTTLPEGVDNGKGARKSRLGQFLSSLRGSDSPIVQKFYDLATGRRKRATVTSLSADIAKRYTAEGDTPVQNNAKVVLSDNAVRHLDNDGHLTGIKLKPEMTTGIEIDANPLTKSDIAMLDGVMQAPDTITNKGNGRDGVRLQIEKRVNDNVRIIADVVKDGNELNIVSVYKQNKSPLTGDLPASVIRAPRNDGEVRTESPRSETATLPNIISEKTNKSKTVAETVANNPTVRAYEAETEKLPDNFDVKHYVSDQVKAQKERSKLPMKERVADATAELKHLVIDDSVAYERYIKDKNERLNIREGVDRVRSSDMIGRQWALDHGMKEIGKMKNKDLDEFQQYLIAKRAVEVAGQGKKTGRSIAADQALIKSVGHKYDAQEKIIRQYTKDMLDYGVENGLIPKKLRNDLLKENPNYVPFNRVFGDYEDQTGFKSKQLGNLSKQTLVQKLKGSERTIENPIESLLANTLRMVNEVERNNTARLIAQSKAFHEKVLADGEKPMKGYDTLSYMVDGKKVSYEVPALVAKEMKNLNSVLPNWAETTLNIVGAPTRWLRTGATQNNPLFALSNLLRDQGQTLVTGNGEGVVKSNLWRNIKGTPKALVATFSPTKKGRTYRAELNRNGVIGTEYRQTYNKGSGDLIGQLQADSRKLTWAADKAAHPMDSLADLIGRTEYFTRAQQYFGTSGDATAKAQAARNNTLNFSRAGTAVRTFNRIIPFLNAGVQGGRATVNSFKNRPIHTALSLGSFAAVAMAARGAFEAQDKELWDRLDDSDKGQNIIIPTEDAHYDPDSNRVEGIIKIPVAQMVYPIMDGVNNMKGDAADLEMLAGDIFTAITGLETPNSKDGLLPVANQLLPTIAKPVAESWIIKKSTYTGNDIVSEYDSNKAPEDKGAKYTTGIARTIAKATGIDAPVVDNFIQNWGGGLATDLSKTFTDNPDNNKDGGGIGAWWNNGFNRRFLSGAITSQYEIADGLAKNYKNEVKENDTFKNLSKKEQEDVLNAIDKDMNSIASMAAKVEQGRAEDIGDSKLSKRQTEITNNGFNANSYIASVTDKKSTYQGNSDGGDVKTMSGNLQDYGRSGGRDNQIEISSKLSGASKSVLEKYNSMSSDDWGKYVYGNSPDVASAEYDLAKAKYDNDVAEGKLTDVQKIKRQKELGKLEVSQKWTKDVRDMYSLAGTKADIQELLGSLGDEDRATMVGRLSLVNIVLS